MKKEKEIILYGQKIDYSRNIKGYYCTICKKYYGDNRHLASLCCVTNRKCMYCGELIKEKWKLACNQCEFEKRKKEHLEKLEKAKLITWKEASNMFFSYVLDKYYTVDEYDIYLDELCENGLTENYVFDTDFRPFSIDLDTLVEIITDDHYEDASDDHTDTIKGSFNISVDEFNGLCLKNEYGSYDVNYSRKIEVEYNESS